MLYQNNAHTRRPMRPHWHVKATQPGAATVETTRMNYGAALAEAKVLVHETQFPGSSLTYTPRAVWGEQIVYDIRGARGEPYAHIGVSGPCFHDHPSDGA